MSGSLNIENITNGLITLRKIRELYNPANRAENGGGAESGPTDVAGGAGEDGNAGGSACAVRAGNGENRNSGGAGNVHPDKLSLAQETMMSIKNLLPMPKEREDGFNHGFSHAFNQGSRYSGVYREIKRHLRGMDRNGPGAADIANILKLVSPILGSRQKVYADKAAKILDILLS